MTGIHPNHDIVVAYLEGKLVQYRDIRNNKRWYDLIPVTRIGNNFPTFTPDLEYRIKPEVKPDIIRDCYVEGRYSGTKSFKWSIVEFREDDIINLRLVFDGNTGELKGAVVL